MSAALDMTIVLHIRGILDVTFGILDVTFGILDVTFGILDVTCGILDVTFGIIDVISSACSDVRRCRCVCMWYSRGIYLGGSGGMLPHPHPPQGENLNF